jgi:hypothetical protein
MSRICVGQVNQGITCLTHNPLVPGSSPGGPPICLSFSSLTFFDLLLQKFAARLASIEFCGAFLRFCNISRHCRSRNQELTIDGNVKTLLMVILFVSSTSASAQFSHQQWQEVLVKYVDDVGFVDYQALSRQRETLDSYVASVAISGPESTPEMFPTSDHRLAFYLNAYNALVFSGVLDRGPEHKSVWRGLISGLSFFILMDVNIDGSTTSLKKLEDDIIRERFADPRIHAAINCASVSCPRLRRTAFEAHNLQAQLDDAMREFVSNRDHVRVVDDVLYLSKIFDWFEEDFIGADIAGGTLIGFINLYRETPLAESLPIRFLPYDKGINAIR